MTHTGVTASISGGSERSVGSAGEITLDASDSYDQDYPYGDAPYSLIVSLLDYIMLYYIVYMVTP
jgi:hypothetical protein